MKTIIKRNKIFLSIALALFIGFGFILFIGANLIYQKESDRQHESEVAHLHSAKLTVTTFFSDISNDLSFFSSYEFTITYFTTFNGGNYFHSRFILYVYKIYLCINNQILLDIVYV